MPLRIDVITLFPTLVSEAVRYGVTARGLKRGLWSMACWNPRDFANDNHRTVDDRPYGGGPGMVMLAEPLNEALEAAKSAQRESGAEPWVIYLSPQGRKLDHARVLELSALPGLVLLAGRYEGVDERLLERHIDDEISIGDFVLSGGELPALVLMDAVVRQLPGILNTEESSTQDSFVNGLLDYQHYTRPEVFEGQPVPKVLLSGNHAAIASWRRKQSLGRTWQRKPQLLEKQTLSEEDLALLAEYQLDAQRQRPDQL